MQAALQDVLERETAHVQVCGEGRLACRCWRELPAWEGGLTRRGVPAQLQKEAACLARPCALLQLPPELRPQHPPATAQAHYQRAAAMRLADLRRQHAHDPAQLAAALRREAPAVEAAQEAATRQELTSFVEMVRGAWGDELGWHGAASRCWACNHSGPPPPPPHPFNLASPCRRQPQALPRLAELLSSRELLLRCFDAAAEEAGDE